MSVNQLFLLTQITFFCLILITGMGSRKGLVLVQKMQGYGGEVDWYPNIDIGHFGRIGQTLILMDLFTHALILSLYIDK